LLLVLLTYPEINGCEAVRNALAPQGGGWYLIPMAGQLVRMGHAVCAPAAQQKLEPHITSSSDVIDYQRAMATALVNVVTCCLITKVSQSYPIGTMLNG
jgi:hypothetical protein